MRTYGTRVLRLIYLFVKDRSLAEDLTQEVFLKVYRHLPSFRSDSQLETWVYRIAVNESKGYLRSWSFRKILPRWNVSEASKTTVESEVIGAFERETIASHVLNLSASYRQVIALRYYADLSIEEIAEVLQTSTGNIRTRLHRARQQLRMKLEKEDVTWISNNS